MPFLKTLDRCSVTEFFQNGTPISRDNATYYIDEVETI